MPYGYVKDRIERGDNPITVKSQAVVINQFFAFINLKYQGETPDITQLGRNDVLDFLQNQHEVKNLSKSTIIKKQSNLKVFFDYLWRSKQIHYDYVSKVDYFKDRPESVSLVEDKEDRDEIKYNYEQLLEYEEKVLRSNISFKSKLLMIFYMKGVALSDIFTFQDFHFTKVGADKLSLKYLSRLGYHAEMLITNPLEVEVIEHAIKKAHSKGTDFILYGLNIKTGEYGPSSAAGRTYLASNINEVVGFTVKSKEIRVAYVNHLYYKLNKSEKEIANMMGRSVSNVEKLRKEGIARMKEFRYNEVQKGLA